MTAPYQLYPDLEPATEAALRSSIRRWGVIYPIVVDQHGHVIDGHHRARIAKELGLKPKTEVRRVRNDEARELARTLNEDRRHLWPVDQRREVVEELATETDEDGVGVHTPDAIAGALGVSRAQVRKDIDQLGTGAKLPAHRRGHDGKVRPATRPLREAPPPDVDARTGEIAGQPSTAGGPTRRPDRADDLAERRTDTERLTDAYLNLHEKLGRVTMQLMQLDPERVAAVLDGGVVDHWRGVEDSVTQEIPQLDAWFRSVLKARPKPFTVVAGGRA